MVQKTGTASEQTSKHAGLLRLQWLHPKEHQAQPDRKKQEKEKKIAAKLAIISSERPWDQAGHSVGGQ